MKKLMLTAVVASTLTLTACNCEHHAAADAAADKASNAVEAGSDAAKAATAAVGAGAAALVANSAFNWGGFDKSSADLGEFPHFSVPDGFKIDGAADGEGFTKLVDGAKGGLNFFDGKEVAVNKGKLAYINMMGDGNGFDQAAFDQKITDQMKELGAVEIFNDVVPAETAAQMGELDGITHEDYMTGEFADRKLRQFVVNHDNGQVLYQVMSDDKHGEVGVLEVDGYMATVPAPVIEETEAEPAPEAEAAPVEEPKTADAMMSQLDANGKFVVQINFDSGKATIRGTDMGDVDTIYKLLSEHPELKLSVEGHTDNTGNAAANQKLSEARATTVMNALVEKGIAADRLKAAGFGDTQPVVSNDTPENREINRRVELVKF